MPVPVNVLVADNAALATILVDVNANRAAVYPAMDAASPSDIIVGCIQVGLNAMTTHAGALYTNTRFPLISVVGEPGVINNVTLDADLTARVTAVAALAGCTEAQLRDLACHVGVLMMSGTATPPYRPSFV